MSGRKVDLTGAKQNIGVWLVKVPKYLSLQWQRATGAGEVGTVRIAKKANSGKTEVSFTLNEELAVTEDPENNPASVPRQHTFGMRSMARQTLAVFTENSSDELAVLGKVVHRVDCKPVLTEDYLGLKQSQVQQPPKLADKLLLQIESPVTNYKPVASHSYHRELEKKKKEEGLRTRADRQLVLDMLFSAFERHQYYNIKDLVDLTKQPVLYLKKILREIGTYNVKGSHKHTWELRPEYRHYGGEKKV